MAVGFFLNYQRSDECLAALQLATVLEDLGHSVRFFPSERAGHVCPKWDSKLKRNSKSSFIEWAEGLSQLVFCDVPPPILLKPLKEAGIKIFFLCSWTHLEADHVAVLPLFDRVLCPSKAVAAFVRDLSKDAKVLAIPWCVALPTTHSNHQTDAKRLGLVWHLDGTQSLYQSSAFLPALKKLVMPQNIYLTVFYTNRMPEESVNMLKDLSVKLDGRMEMIKNANWEQQVLTTAAHDLTLWPTLMENFGMPGLLSLAAGTPVIGFDHPIVGEVVKHEVTGVLVPCALQFDGLKVPSAVFDAKNYLEVTQKVLSDPDFIARMRKHAQERQDHRRVQFEAVVLALFN